MKSNRFREAMANGRIPIGRMIMEFGTRGIAKILDSADLYLLSTTWSTAALTWNVSVTLIAWSKACSDAPFVRVP